MFRTQDKSMSYLNNHTLRFLTQVKLEFPVTSPHVQNFSGQYN